MIPDLYSLDTVRSFETAFLETAGDIGGNAPAVWEGPWIVADAANIKQTEYCGNIGEGQETQKRATRDDDHKPKEIILRIP